MNVKILLDMKLFIIFRVAASQLHSFTIKCIIIFLVFMRNSIFLQGQEISCGTFHDGELKNPNFEAQAKLPLSCFSEPHIKYVRVNVHFIQDLNGGQNFGQNGDNCPGSLLNKTGYQYAKEQIDELNEVYFRCNQKANLPCFSNQPNSIPIENKRIFFLLKGVYFHQDAQLHTVNTNFFVDAIHNKYAVNKETEINIYYINRTENGNYQKGSGVANGLANYQAGLAIQIHGDWFNYCINDDVWQNSADLLAHEIGHTLGLFHNFEPDGCDDTYIDTLISRTWYDDLTLCGEANHNGNDNNMMSYSKNKRSLTPCQIERMHSFLENDLSSYVEYCKPLVECQSNSENLTCCIPVSNTCVQSQPNFYIPSNLCQNIKWNQNDLFLDLRASWNYDEYQITVCETQFRYSNQCIGNFTQTGIISGQIHQVINLRTYFNYNFQANKMYKVVLLK